MDVVKYLLMSMNELLNCDLIFSINRPRNIVTFYDGQFNSSDMLNMENDFLYYIMYDPVKKTPLIITRMLVGNAENVPFEIPGFIITYRDKTDITWMPNAVAALFVEEEANSINSDIPAIGPM